MGKNLCLVAVFFSLAIVGSTGDEEVNTAVDAQGQNDVASMNVEEINSNEVVVNSNGGAGGGGRVGWGWGGGGGGGNSGGGWGWGGGGGGSTSWRWGCNSNPEGKRGHNLQRKREFAVEDFKKGEFAQCVVEGRCKGMRLDCPLHCGGPCFYDCRHMCKAHCKR
ncbi:hypothetical protein ABFX02_14G300700 [Erythranthe guttata]